MKGLSIGQKAKRYDEALERVKELLSRCRTNRDRRTMVYRVEDIESIFPELKESEDEKIRKEIISHLQYLAQYCRESMPNVDNWIAWLEKQGEQKPTLPKWKYKNDNTPLLRDSLILNKYGCVAKSPSGAFVNDVWVIDYDELAKLPKEELEKQGEQETLCDKCRKEHPSHSCQDITELGRCAVEHEQETDNSYCQENCKGFQETGRCFCDGECKAKKENKFKPEFKVGDWITDGCLHCKIIQVLDECYIVDSKFGKTSIFFKREYNYHLWSIQDARDGDILAGSKDEVILMFRGIGNTEWNDVIDYHCYYDCYRKEFIVQEKLGFWGNVDDTELKPATKEQRDLLFQKMKEAGYEWDSKKKEIYGYE